MSVYIPDHTGDFDWRNGSSEKKGPCWTWLIYGPNVVETIRFWTPNLAQIVDPQAAKSWCVVPLSEKKVAK